MLLTEINYQQLPKKKLLKKMILVIKSDNRRIKIKEMVIIKSYLHILLFYKSYLIWKKTYP